MSEKQNTKASGFAILPRLDFENTKDEMIYYRLVMKANFKPSENCERGQLITSYSHLSEETGWSYDVIRGCFKRLSLMGLVNWTILKGKRGLLITIMGYEKMQNLTTYKENKQQAEAPPPKKETPIPKPKNYFDSFIMAFNRQPTAFQADDINQLIDNDGLPEELVCWLFEKAGHGGHHYKWAQSVLNSWVQKGIRTIEAADKEMKEFEQRKQRRNGRQQSQEKKPAPNSEYSYGF
ncbi:DnaD domain-containing protein [Mycobacteroides abscessus]|uniref:DnaD domain-containing protein n=1 Tax=Mycobacteroides abscessus TaxID=36809 RepID=UPI0012FFEC69